VEATTDASDIASASMDVSADDSDAEAASEGARLSLLSPVVLGPAQRQPDDQATLATPLRRNGSGLPTYAPNRPK
jgi:hypothetical protein